MPIAELVDSELSCLLKQGEHLKNATQSHFRNGYFKISNAVLEMLNEIPESELSENERRVKRNLEVYMFFKPLEAAQQAINENNEIDENLLALLQEYNKTQNDFFNFVVGSRFAGEVIFEQVQAKKTKYKWDSEHPSK